MEIEMGIQIVAIHYGQIYDGEALSIIKDKL